MHSPSAEAMIGSIAVGQGNIQPDAKVYIKQNLRVDGGITGSVTGSFKGDGTNIKNIVTASYALTASFAMNAANASDVTAFNNFTASYRTDSASFDSRIDSISGTPFRIVSGSTQVTAYITGKVIVSGSDNLQFIVSGSGSFTGTMQAQSFFQNSLRALKENIAPFTASAVELINTLDIVSFNYKKNTHLTNVGIIADDSHEFFLQRITT